MSFLDGFFRGYNAIHAAGIQLVKRERINVLAPLIAADDSVHDWTAISIPPASGATAGSLSSADFAKLQALAPGSFAPFVLPAVHPDGPATGDISTIVLFAAPLISSKVTTIEARALGALTAHATNNRQVEFCDVDAAGAYSAVLFTTVTTSIGSGGTGNWTATATVFTWTANYTLPAGHSLVAVCKSNNTGVVFPGLAYRIT